MSKKQHKNYSNIQRVKIGGKKIVRKVSIKSGKGHKSVSYYNNNKLISTIKKKLKPVETSLISAGKFIPGLFKDCPCNKTRKK